MSFEQKFIRLRIDRRLFDNRLFLFARQSDAQFFRNGVCDFLLYHQYIRRSPIVLFAPQLTIITRINHLDSD